MYQCSLPAAAPANPRAREIFTNFTRRWIVMFTVFVYHRLQTTEGGCIQIMKRLRALFFMPVAFLLVAFQSGAADVICEQVIERAMQTAQTDCAGLGRNQACYGNHVLEAEPQPGFSNFNFDDIGDRIDITGLQSLRLSAMDLNVDLWGVALMRLQANIPHQLVTRNVTMVLFGDVEVRNRVRAPNLVAVRPATASFVNVRRYPRLDAFVVSTIEPNEIAIADGRLEGSGWFHVQLLETGERGWVSARTVIPIGDPASLNVVNIQSAEFGPMQAFYLETGAPEAACGTVPQNGVLIQTPDGVATVDLWVNEVKIRLGSTAFVQATADTGLNIKMIEGATEVEALGVDQFAVAGTEVTVALNQDLQPAEPPPLPQAYAPESVEALPVTILDRPVEIAPPLDQAAVDELNKLNLADAETPTLEPPTVVPATGVPPTSTPLPPPTSTPVPPPTSTSAPPTSTPVPLPTSTPVPPTSTPVPLPTSTSAPPSHTPVPPTTSTSAPPSHTPVPPTYTSTP
jgi:hypothetical protein